MTTEELKNSDPSCDFDVYVNNIGKHIVKKHRLHSERNNSPTVVTAVTNIELQQNEIDTKNIQFNENLKPGYWNRNISKEIQCLMEKEIEDAQIDFREYCYLLSLFKFTSSPNYMENLIVKEISNLELPPSNQCYSHSNKEFHNLKVKCNDYCNLIFTKAKKLMKPKNLYLI